MELETYGKRLDWSFAVGLIKRRKGWVEVQEKVVLKQFDKSEEEE